MRKVDAEVWGIASSAASAPGRPPATARCHGNKNKVGPETVVQTTMRHSQQWDAVNE